MVGKITEAAGGIVVRKGAGRLIAVVQRSKDDAWVLPRGKLKRGENPVAAARREVVEETGHRVEVHEFLGAITYRAGGRPKVVQFWRMEAEVEPSHELMSDISAVEWLPLKAAVRRLSYPLEKLFLRHTAARALRKRRKAASKPKAKPGKTSKVKTSKVKAVNKAKSKKSAAKRPVLKSKSGTASTRAKNKAGKGKSSSKSRSNGKSKKQNRQKRPGQRRARASGFGQVEESQRQEESRTQERQHA